MNNTDEFKNVISSAKNYKHNSFKRRFIVPFLSGALGCSLVLRNLFWSSKYKKQNHWRNKNLFYNKQYISKYRNNK